MCGAEHGAFVDDVLDGAGRCVIHNVLDVKKIADVVGYDVVFDGMVVAAVGVTDDARGVFLLIFLLSGLSFCRKSLVSCSSLSLLFPGHAHSRRLFQEQRLEACL